MICYDFDKTIYKKDSAIQFFLFCLKLKPILCFHFIKCCFLAILNAFGIIKTKAFKEKFFSFVKHFNNIDEIVEKFWKKESKNINKWYLDQKQDTDIICSASPEFLVKPIFSIINEKATVICTNYNLSTCKIDGENLKGDNKVSALKEYLKNENITFDAVYTDSMSDFPILDLTENKFIVGRKNQPYTFGKQKPKLLTKIRYTIKQLRIKHYVKNGLIFLPLFFSGQLSNLSAILYSISGFVSFCLIASFVYVINDLFDAKNDRKHSRKRKRPIACYMIKTYEAIILATLLFVASITLNIITLGINYWSLGILVGYAILNLLYSFALKHIPIVDAFVLALCYLVRVLFGGLIINTAVSKWLYLTILCGALFMGFGKRRNELKQETSSTRKVNEFYNYNFLDKNLYICLAMSLVFYSLWAIDLNFDKGQFNRFLLLVTIPLVYFIMMKYSLDIEQSENNGDPIDVLLKDITLILSVIIFVALIIVAVYVPINISLF